MRAPARGRGDDARRRSAGGHVRRGGRPGTDGAARRPRCRVRRVPRAHRRSGFDGRRRPRSEPAARPAPGPETVARPGLPRPGYRRQSRRARRRRRRCCSSSAPPSSFAIFGGWLPASRGRCVRGHVPGRLAIEARRDRRRADAREAWPRMIEEMRLLTGSLGRSMPQALFDVGRRGPTRCSASFAAAQREWMISTDFARTVEVLKHGLADPTADTTCETLLVAHEVGGSDLDRRLAALDRRPPADLQGRKDARSKQAGVRFARRFVLLVPLGMALAGLSIGTGQQAYDTTGGQLGVAVALAMIVGVLDLGGAADAAPRGAAGVPGWRGREVVAAGRVAPVGRSRSWSSSEARWFARRPLADRLRPYTLSAAPAVEGRGIVVGRVVPGRDRPVVEPPRRTAQPPVRRQRGALGVRLDRIHSPYDVTAFRVRQFGAALAALVVGAVAVLRPPAAGRGRSAWCCSAAPLLSFLVLEQRVSQQSTMWQRRVFLELPVVAEQLATLLSSGYSLGGALNRLAHRGQGACAQDLRTGDGPGPPGPDRGRGGAGMGAAGQGRRPRPPRPGAGAELRSRRSGQVDQRRGAQHPHATCNERWSRPWSGGPRPVWIPVTVATLVPGVILLAIPFTQALKLFTA